MPAYINEAMMSEPTDAITGSMSRPTNDELGDEPVFVLNGRDPAAWIAVAIYRSIRLEMGDSKDDLNTTYEAAVAMKRYSSRLLGKGSDGAREAFSRLVMGDETAADRIVAAQNGSSED